MKIVAVIPARYGSSRMKGKPLADLCGKPMIWWVYHQVKQSEKIDAVYVATDHRQIASVCDSCGIPCIMTSPNHCTSTERIYEVTQHVSADIYLCVNGDEPLIEPSVIEHVIPESLDSFFAANLITKIHSPVEAIDNTNIKVVTTEDGTALFMSRSPIPHPKSSILFDYYKHLGVLSYSLEALRFFAETPKGKLEQIEDINELRFIEHGKKLKMIPVESHTLSVDTPKDLEYVKKIIGQKLERGEIQL